ncbi:hypothetical protein [Xanthobacter sp. YC-JY1]|uniref:hypothetical protein n=1 Tax=Xanthobacter sp. YC-JY1 TaxID=2419844 RepID=UPI001F309A16|nr:hypothetical protein [Xanthobacter sp. YC-JY1]UJX46655.1 hypothetical protein D7006_19400 [Xanthobacter sp. YC-JY1]
MTGEISAAARGSEGAIIISERALELMVIEVAEDAAEKAVRKVLKEIGLSTSDEARIEEARADIEHLRRFRRMWNRAALVVGTAVLTVVAGGALAVFWLGIKTHVLKQP